MPEDRQWEYHLHACKILQQEKDEARAVQALCSNRSWLLKQLPSTGPLLRPKKGQRVAMQSTRSILHGYFNPNYSFGINGNIHVHQQRICHFLQGI